MGMESQPGPLRAPVILVPLHFGDPKRYTAWLEVPVPMDQPNRPVER